MSPLVIKPGSTSHSAYNLREAHTQAEERHTLSVLVDNEPGVLARVIGLFSGRGYNIDSLTVAETDHASHLSRITIVTTGTPQVIEQIKAQLGRLVPVHDVHDLTVEGEHLERELALIKVVATGEQRVEALRMADLLGARVVDVTLESFVFELAQATQEIDHFVDLMRPIGLAEVTRTGVCAMLRGADAFKSEEPQPEPARSSKSAPAKPAPAKSGAVKSASAKSAPAKSAPAKSASSKAGKPGSGKGASGKGASGKGASGKAKTRKPEAAR